MDKFLEVIGSLGVTAILLIMIGIVLNTRGGTDTALTILGMLPWAIPGIVGCVVIAAFGNMLGQLKAIRSASEKQAALFQELMLRRTGK